MRTWFGIRRLYEPRFQLRVITGLAVLMASYYVAWSVQQWFTLDANALRFDFANYFSGAQAAAHGGDIYADFKRLWGTQAWTVAYIYPPFFALLLAPLTGLGLVAAGRVWMLIVHGTFLAALWLILRLCPELPRIGRRLFLLAAFAFMPVYLNVKFQQVATVWLLLLAGMLWAAVRHDRVAGLFAALAASLKVTPLFFLPLFVVVNRRRAALWGVALLAAVTGASLALAPASWQFFTVVLPRIGLGTSNWDNGSINGMVSRFVAFFPTAFGTATTPIGEGLVVGGTLVVLGFTLWHAGSGGFKAWRLRLATGAMVTALLMVSSVTWQHHLVTLLLPLAIAMAWVAARHPGTRFWWGLLVGYALCWTDRRIVPLPPDQVVHGAAQAILVLGATSIKLAGLTLLWAMFLRMLAWERAAIRRQAEPSIAASSAA
jgi:hypothetical protein